MTSHAASQTLTVDPRSQPRVAIDLRGSIRLATGQHPCTVSEISLSGALLANCPVVPKGTEGILRCHDLDMLFTAISPRGELLGIRFDEQLDSLNVPSGAEPLSAEDAARIVENRRFFRRLATPHVLENAA